MRKSGVASMSVEGMSKGCAVVRGTVCITTCALKHKVRVDA